MDRSTGKNVAIKILESITDNLEEIEEEYLVLRDLSQHPNLPTFVGIFLRKGVSFEDDQLWFVMEVSKKKRKIYFYLKLQYINTAAKKKSKNSINGIIIFQLCTGGSVTDLVQGTN